MHYRRICNNIQSGYRFSRRQFNIFFGNRAFDCGIPCVLAPLLQEVRVTSGSLDDIVRAYEEQVGFVEKHGGRLQLR